MNALFLGVVDEFAGQRVGRGPVGDDDGVLRVAGPLDEEVPGEAALHVGHRGQHHLQRGKNRLRNYLWGTLTKNRTVLNGWP